MSNPGHGVEHSTLVAVLRARALEHPDKTAYRFLVDGEESGPALTYGQLDTAARAIASALEQAGARGERALLLYPPGLDFATAFFGCLYAGTVAVPAYPPSRRTLSRLRSIVCNAQPAVVLTTASKRKGFASLTRGVTELSEADWLATDEVETDLAAAWEPSTATGETLALLQYTSGSTAAPKGVEVTHGHLLANEEMIRRAFAQSEESIVVGWLPLYHDMGLIGNLLQPIYSGGTCILMSPVAFLRRPLRWLEAISHYRATTSGGPNFAYDLCLNKIDEAARESLDLSSWQVAFSGAEPVRAETLRRFSDTFGPCGFRPSAFFPCYGLAEATLLVSGGEVDAAPKVRRVEARALEAHRVVELPSNCDSQDDGGRDLVACGQGWGQEVAIVDPESCRRVPPDHVGEIWVQGPSVARGYWRAPEATERDFHGRPVGEDDPDGFLRTGDLGFFADGELFVTGRLKDLIILRGRNLYPQDVEHTVIDAHVALSTSAAFSIDLEGEERLVVVAELERRAKVEPEEVAKTVRQAVSEVHQARIHELVLVATGGVPKTSSGKVQRRACRAAYLSDELSIVGRSRLTLEGGGAEEVEVERVPAEIDLEDLATVEASERAPILEAFLKSRVARAAGVAEKDVDVGRPLTALGLDSLAAVELTSDLQSTLGVALAPTSLLEGSSLCGLAEEILESLETPVRETWVPIGETLGDHALSYGQQALWFLHRLAPQSGAYNIAAAAQILGDLDPEALRAALALLVARHPALRTHFPEVANQPVQRVQEDSESAFEWTLEEATEWPQAQVEECLASAAVRAFDLERPPLVRGLLLRRGAAEHVFLLTVHHAVADFWSLAVLLDELGRAYEALNHRQDVPWAPLELRYTDFVHWQRARLETDEGRRLEAYWRQQLADLPMVLNLPTDRPRPPIQTDRGAACSRRLPAVLGDSLSQLRQAQGATSFMILLAVFQALLQRYSGEPRMVVGSPTAGRGRPELDDVVGYFVNPLALAGDLSGDPRFCDHLARTGRTVLDALRHQDLPFDRLVERLRPDRDPSRSPVFQVMLSWQQMPPRLAGRDLAAFALGQEGGQLEIGGLRWRSMALAQRSVQLDLNLLAATDDDGLRLAMQYNRDLFDATTVGRMLEHFERLLLAVCEQPERRLSRLPLLGASERRQLLVERNATSVDVPSGLGIHRLIDPAVQGTPDAIAITSEDHWLSYRELDRRVTQVTQRLLEAGAKPETPVAICTSPGPEMVFALLGVLRAGALYVPLDPTYPRERLAFMLEDVYRDAPTRILLTSERWHPMLRELAGEDAQLLGLESLLGREASGDPVDGAFDDLGSGGRRDAGVRDASAAYVIYTSGSTGRPKGVVIPQRAAVNFLASMRRQPGLGATDTLLAVTTLAFDISVLEIFLPLAVGGRLVLPSRQTVADGQALAATLAKQRATCLQATPATWRLLVETGWQGADELTLLCGGEALPRELAQQLLGRGRELWNMYGPTETTVWSAVSRVEASEAPVPLGGPIANTQIYVLDHHLEPVPVGVPGEVYIAGRGLARGYLRRPRLSAERFLPDPLASAPGGRLYRVGDRARHRLAGGLEFLGRVDHQIKVRGFRVEPGEIEAALEQHPSVSESAVTLRELSPGDQRLVAYLVPRGEAPATTELRDFLRRRLPQHMVPSELVTLASAPRTDNGKLDRKALATAAGSSAADLSPAGPSPADSETSAVDSIERVVADAWCEVLAVERVDRNVSFFDAGGHSLLLARLHSRLAEHFARPDLTLVDLFRHPTVASQARLLSGVSEMMAASPHGLPTEASPIAREPETEIAIIGLAGRFPGASDVRELWRHLRDGVESITFFSNDELADEVEAATLADPSYVKARGVLERAAEFDAGFFGFNPREAEIMDPQHRLFLEGAWQALEDAGYDPSRAPGKVGVFAAVGINTYLLEAGREVLESAAGSYQAFIGNDKDFVPTRVSYQLGLRGPSVNVQTACSSSLVAVHLACQSLIRGESTMALAGGVTARFPQRRGYFHRQGGILSADGHCRAFDAESTGTVLGNGLGIVVLKPLAQALADGDAVRAVIKGSAINNDGALKIGYTAPSVEGQAEVIGQALQAAGVDPKMVSYVEAHGTGTQLGDPIEVAALSQAFAGVGEGSACALGSIKTNIGHLDTAAGVAGLIKTVLALEHRELPPSLGFAAPNPRIDFNQGPFVVNHELKPWHSEGPRHAGVSSFGIGGTNAHVVLEEAPPRPAASASRRHQLVLLSARSEAALEQAASDLAQHLENPDLKDLDPESPDLDLADVAFTLATGRRSHEWRSIVVAGDRSDAADVLATANERLLRSRTVGDAAPEIVFLFPGQGAQHVGMARRLYEREPMFRQQLERCSSRLEPELGIDLLRVIYPNAADAEEASQRLRRTELAQPAIFAVEYALARLWMSWGVQPAAMVGHSVGELVAACLAGVFELDDALELVALRGRLMQALPGGSMLAVPRPAVELEPLLPQDVSLAAINGPAACVVSGPETAITQLEQKLNRRQTPGRRLHTSHAFHSTMMEPAALPFIEAVAKRRLTAPGIPFASNLSGERITAAEATDPAYWGQLLIAPVRFSAGLAAFTRDSTACLEVGPGQTLSTLGRQQARETPFIASLPHPRQPRSEEESVLEALGRLWLAGTEVDWTGFYEGQRRRRVSLPTYPFERQRYWLESSRSDRVAESVSGHPPQIQKNDLDGSFYAPVWQQCHRTRPVLSPPRATRESQRWLVFSPGTAFVAGLIERLQTAGQQVTTVTPGDGFAQLSDEAFTLDPSRPEDFRSLIEALGPVDRVLHAWSLAPADGAPLDRLQEAQERGFNGLLLWFQALAFSDSAALQLTVLTQDAHRLGGEARHRPEQAILLGLLKSLSQETPRLSCRAIDVSAIDVSAIDEEPSQRLLVPPLDDLLEELLAPMDEAEIALRGGHRWRRSFESLPLPAADEASILQPGAVILITGGLGGIGLELAEELAEKSAARLVLVGRTELPPKDAGATWCAERAECGEDDAVRRWLHRLQALEASGAEVLTVSADVTDRQAVASVIRQARDRFGPIEGVIHAAGVAGGGVLKTRTPRAAAEVLAPKARGTLVLEEALADEPLQFFLLCSSITAIAGGLGQGDYAAANAFLDAFAQARTRRRGPRVVALGWDRWPGIGMAAGGAHPLLGDRLLSTPQRAVYRQVMTAPDHWVLSEHRIAGHPTVPGAAYLEMARAAFAERATGGVTELRDVIFSAPLAVADGERREVLTVIDHSNEAASAFRVVSRLLGDSAGWQQHVQGKIEVSESAEATEAFDLDAARRRCGEAIADRSQLAGTGQGLVETGRRWQTLRSLRLGPQEMLAELCLDDDLTGDLMQHELHPALLDVATGFVRLGQDDDYLPLAYERMQVDGPLPARLFSHAALQAESGETIQADITLLDDAGTPRVRISGFAMRRVNQQSVQELEQRQGFTTVEKGREDRVAFRDSPATWLDDGIDPKQGRAALWRVLANVGPSHLVISPRNLDAVVDAYRSFDPTRLLADLAVLEDGGGPDGPSTRHQRPELASAYVAPSAEMETSIADIWQRLLGIDRVGVDDNFFELGGTSLTGVEVVAELKRQLGREIPAVSIFEAPTVRSLAKVLAPAEEAPPAFSRARNRIRKKKAALGRRSRGRRRRVGDPTKVR